MARRTVSELNIPIKASAAGVKMGVNDAKRELRGFKGGAVSAMKGAAVAATATAAAIAGIGVAAKKAFDRLKEAASSYDELVKRARALNVEVRELEAASLLAEFSGADADKAGMAMERLSISIGDAAKGTGEAAEAFERLGLDATALKGQSVVKSMQDIGAALQSVSTRAEQLDILSALVGSRQAGSLINTFDAMAGGLGQIENLIDAVGLSVDKVDADNIEEMNDALGLAAASSEAFWRGLVAELSPAITDLALAAAEFMAEMRPFVPAIARTIEEVTKFTAALNPLVWAMKGAANVARKLGFVVDKDVAKKFDEARAPVAAITTDIVKTKDVVDELKTSMEEAFSPDKVAKLRDEMARLRDVDAPGFRPGSTFGGDARTQGGLSAISEAIRNRREQMQEDRKRAKEHAERDKRRDEILKELLVEMRKPKETLRVKKHDIVG